jgi:hypothetical protein
LSVPLEAVASAAVLYRFMKSGFSYVAKWRMTKVMREACSLYDK